MSRSVIKNIDSKVISTLFPIGIFIFSLYVVDYYISYQESCNLFLYRYEYMLKSITADGGILEYISSFFTQLFYYRWLGAVTITAIAYLHFILMQRVTKSQNFAILSTLCNLFMLTNYTTPFTLLVGTTAPLLIPAFIYSFTKNSKSRSIATSVIATIFAIYLWNIVPPEYIIEYKYQGGINSILILFSLAPIYSLIPFTKKRLFKSGLTATVLILIPFTIYSGLSNFNSVMLRTRDSANRSDWDKILELNRPDNIDNQLQIYYTNLALAKRAVLSEEMFKYNQVLGTRGLLLNWSITRGHSSEDGSAAYAAAGLINETHHWAYEALVFKGESGTTLKRLINYNIDLKHYGAARLFSEILRETLFYSRWAEDKLNSIENKVEGDDI